jgi:hypothetical protein
MDGDTLVVGRAYYQLGFADVDGRIPKVTPVFYLGTNVMVDDVPGKTTHYFQDALSHRECGPATGAMRPHPDIEPYVVQVAPEELGESLLTLDGVIAALRRAADQALPT